VPGRGGGKLGGESGMRMRIGIRIGMGKAAKPEV